MGEARLPSEHLAGLQRWGSHQFPRGPSSGQVRVRAAAQAPRPPPASAAARPAREGARRAAGSGAASGMSRYTRPPNTSLFVRNVADATRLVNTGPRGSTGRGAGVSGCGLGSGGLSGCRCPPGCPVCRAAGCRGAIRVLGCRSCVGVLAGCWECWPGVGVPLRAVGVSGFWGAGQVLGCGRDVKMLAGCQGEDWVAPAVVAVLAQALVSLRSAGTAH